MVGATPDAGKDVSREVKRGLTGLVGCLRAGSSWSCRARSSGGGYLAGSSDLKVEVRVAEGRGRRRTGDLGMLVGWMWDTSEERVFCIRFARSLSRLSVTVGGKDL